MDQDSPNPYQSPAPDLSVPPIFPEGIPVPASLGLRFANLIVDRIVTMVLAGGVGLVIGLVAPSDAEEPVSTLVSFGIAMVVILGYYAVMEAAFGRTVGKFVTGTKVITSDGGKPTPGQSVLRTLCRLIPFEPFSFLGSANRGWHDSLTKTWVVKAR